MAKIETYASTAKIIEDEIKKVLKSKGLIDTGKLYNSIKVTGNKDGYKVNAEDYFKYVNSEEKVMDVVMVNDKVKTAIASAMANDIKAAIIKQIKP